MITPVLAVVSNVFSQVCTVYAYMSSLSFGQYICVNVRPLISPVKSRYGQKQNHRRVCCIDQIKCSLSIDR